MSYENHIRFIQLMEEPLWLKVSIPIQSKSWTEGTHPQKLCHIGRPSECLNHHNQRLSKIFLAGVHFLLQTYSVLL